MLYLDIYDAFLYKLFNSNLFRRIVSDLTTYNYL